MTREKTEGAVQEVSFENISARKNKILCVH